MDLGKLTLIIPAKKEHESLPVVLKELIKFDLNIIVVMPCNDNLTFESIKNFDCIKVFQKNDGFGSAIIEGLSKSSTEFSCIFNADGSFDPKYLKEMLQILSNKNLDFIISSRYQNEGGSDDDTFITSLGNFFFTRLCNFLFNLKCTDVLYNYILGRTKSFNSLNLIQRDFTFCVEIILKAKINGFKYENFTSYERSRLKGTKKVNEFRDGMLILIYIIKKFLKIK